jgi:hypothetical protein
VETLLLAVADHIERADDVARRLIEQVDNAALDAPEESAEEAGTATGSATSTSAPAGRP